MKASIYPPVTVVGAGVFGLCAALALADAGCRVRLFDDAATGSNASAVAAGMLAPISEALFDPLAAPHQSLLIEARNRWLRLEKGAVGIAIDRSGVRLAETDDIIGEDWRISDVTTALETLRRRLFFDGGEIVSERFSAPDLSPGGLIILAPGANAAALTAFAPELSHLSPIKGQIARLHGGPAAGPVVRWVGGYLVPHSGGALLGATMEPGVADLSLDPAVLAALRDQAAIYVPEVAGLAFTGSAGVRMSSPDGLPLIGPSTTPGVFLAAGARRNGWLLAPLVGEMIAAYVTGTDPGPWASALHRADSGVSGVGGRGK